ARGGQQRTSPLFRSQGVLPRVRGTAAGAVACCPLRVVLAASAAISAWLLVQVGFPAMRRPGHGRLVLLPLRPPPPLLAGHLSRGCVLPWPSPPTLVVLAGQAGCSRDRQVNF